MNRQITIDRQAVYHIADAANLCELAPSALAAAIKSGELPATKRSRRTYIEGDALWRWLTGRPQETEGGNRG